MKKKGYLFLTVAMFMMTILFLGSESKAAMTSWSAEQPPEGAKGVEKRTEYRFRDKSTKTSVVIDHYSYTDDGVLYLTINEYSLYPRVYYDNKEKYQNDYYLVDQYCFRINEKKQQVERLNFPKVNAKDYYNVNKLDNAQY